MEKKYFFVHPKYLILLLLIFAISALFLGFTGAYLYSRIQGGTPPIKVPFIIYLNSIWLILSSISLLGANKAYEYDDTNRYKIALGLTFLFSIMFLISQIFGWYALIDMNLGVTASTMSGYFYLISGLHLAHLLIGIPFLGFFLIDAHKNIKTPISVLIYFSDDEKKLNLKLLNTYWHFLDILWLYLIIFFAINYII